MTKIGERDFSAATVKALRARAISIIGITSAPDATGSFLNSERVYQLNDNGTGRIRSHAQVRALAANA